MGIRNLLTFLNSKHLIKEIPISNFSNKRIAIDCSNLFYRLKSVTLSDDYLSFINFDTLEINKEVLMNKFTEKLQIFINSLLALKIIPVFVFEGEPPSEKDNVKKIRTERKLSIKKQIADLMLKKEKTLEDIENYINYLKQSFDIDEESNKALEIIKKLKLPYYLCKGEAEKLCSMLCIEEKVSAVFSADSDNLAYGCTTLILGKGKGKNKVKVINLYEVLQILNMEFKTFVDFCIMSGCDYNQNISGIGIIGSYNLLSQHHSIDNLPIKFNVDILNHINCRSMFLYQRSDTLYKEKYDNENSVILSNFSKFKNIKFQNEIFVY